MQPNIWKKKGGTTIIPVIFFILFYILYFVFYSYYLINPSNQTLNNTVNISNNDSDKMTVSIGSVSIHVPNYMKREKNTTGVDNANLTVLSIRKEKSLLLFFPCSFNSLINS